MEINIEKKEVIDYKYLDWFILIMFQVECYILLEVYVFFKKKGIHEERKECVGKKKNFFFTEVKLSSDI